MQRLHKPSAILPCIHPKHSSSRDGLKDSPSLSRFAVDILAPIGMLGFGNPRKVRATSGTIALEEDIEGRQAVHPVRRRGKIIMVVGEKAVFVVPLHGDLF